MNRFSPKSAEFHLKQDFTRREAVKLFEDCRLLVVVWLLNEADHGIDGRLRTVIGKYRPNELVMYAKTSAQAVMHVTHQLCRFAGQIPAPGDNIRGVREVAEEPS